jgi:hypothetical protein
MIQLPTVGLPPDISLELAALQTQVDQGESHGTRVTLARALFSRRNRKDDRIFRVVRETLSKMCSGAQRCGYCEDSAADEVEHIKPKHLFPNEVFLWENYLYACGPCNGPKNNKFAVFDLETGNVVHITRLWAATATAPPTGDPVLIDPRQEDPLHFFELDLRDTFQFVPAFELNALERQRAVYTEQILRLNERDLLVQARKTAYGSYVARLKEYVAEKKNNPNSPRLSLYVRGLQRMDHPTVWREIQRQRQRINVLSKLFEDAPEALEW